MPRSFDLLAPLVGRILVGGFFLWSGIEATLNFPTEVFKFGGLGEPISLAITSIFISIQVLGGSALVVGFKTRPVALLLAIYATLTAFLYIAFSHAPQQEIFLQSLAIVGGLLYISENKKRPS
jgi:putative oxidoreductase